MKSRYNYQKIDVCLRRREPINQKLGARMSKIALEIYIIKLEGC